MLFFITLDFIFHKFLITFFHIHGGCNAADRAQAVTGKYSTFDEK